MLWNSLNLLRINSVDTLINQIFVVLIVIVSVSIIIYLNILIFDGVHFNVKY